MQLSDEDRNWFTTVFTSLIAASEERTARLITASIAESEARTKEAIEATENSLLTAFHQRASPLEIKVRAHGMAIGAFEGEKENSIEQAKKLIELERRIAKLEKAS